MLERIPIIQRHPSAAKEVSVFCTIPREVQRKPDAALTKLSFLTGRFAVKVSTFFSDFPLSSKRITIKKSIVK